MKSVEMQMRFLNIYSVIRMPPIALLSEENCRALTGKFTYDTSSDMDAGIRL